MADGTLLAAWRLLLHALVVRAASELLEHLQVVEVVRVSQLVAIRQLVLGRGHVSFRVIATDGLRVVRGLRLMQVLLDSDELTGRSQVV